MNVKYKVENFKKLKYLNIIYLPIFIDDNTN